LGSAAIVFRVSAVLEENTVDDFLILISDRGDLFRYGEDHMIVGDLQKLGLPVLDPLRAGQTLAFGAVSIATAIEGVAFMAALITTFQMTTKNGSAAHLDGGHGAPLSH
jgi:hypothetical protein